MVNRVVLVANELKHHGHWLVTTRSGGNGLQLRAALPRAASGVIAPCAPVHQRPSPSRGNEGRGDRPTLVHLAVKHTMSALRAVACWDSSASKLPTPSCQCRTWRCLSASAGAILLRPR
eukprot:7633411-Pyramimonas_sp.AAC.1